jgi:hypothetical protein
VHIESGGLSDAMLWENKITGKTYRLKNEGDQVILFIEGDAEKK